MPLIRMCIESETAGEIPGERSPPSAYTVAESVSPLEDGLFIMVGRTLSTAPNRSPQTLLSNLRVYNFPAVITNDNLCIFVIFV